VVTRCWCRPCASSLDWRPCNVLLLLYACGHNLVSSNWNHGVCGAGRDWFNIAVDLVKVLTRCCCRCWRSPWWLALSYGTRGNWFILASEAFLSQPSLRTTFSAPTQVSGHHHVCLAAALWAGSHWRSCTGPTGAAQMLRSGDTHYFVLCIILTAYASSPSLGILKKFIQG